MAQRAKALNLEDRSWYCCPHISLLYLEDQDQFEDVDDHQSELAREAGPDPHLVAKERCCSWNWAKNYPDKETTTLKKRLVLKLDQVEVGQLFLINDSLLKQN